MTKQEEIVEIQVENIVPDPENLRQWFDEQDIRALADNMLEHGQMDSIIVFRNEGDTYDLLDGERRWRAAKLAGLVSLRARIVPKPSATELLCKKISRAMQTRNLTMQEEVKALEQGLEALGLRDNPDAWPSAAKKLGVKPSVLRERMRIASLSPLLRSEFESGGLDYTIAQTLGRVDNHNLQEKAAAFIKESHLSNRFVMAKFIPTLLENPSKPMLEVYDITRLSERFRYARPRKEEEVPETIADKIDEMLVTFRSCERWLEAAGKEDLISYLEPANFNTKRLLTTLRRLNAMISAFVSAYVRRGKDTEVTVDKLLGQPQKLLTSKEPDER